MSDTIGLDGKDYYSNKSIEGRLKRRAGKGEDWCRSSGQGGSIGTSVSLTMQSAKDNVPSETVLFIVNLDKTRPSMLEWTVFTVVVLRLPVLCLSD